MTHVLIIDDNGTGIDVLGALLTAQNVSYTGIQDPTQIRNLIANNGSFDAIFLDLEMPSINGYEMLEILKKELHISAPVIAYSVHTSEITTARELGFDGFLGKPLRRQDFPENLKKILSGKAVWESN
jgi:two-component system cell cycle response regulator DivK